ncbi:hypothetical protein [Nonomuraea sp. NPDC002799]
MIITRTQATPVAFRDPPLLNATGVHRPWALRTIVDLVTDQDLTGSSEPYGHLAHLRKVRERAQALNELHVRAAHTPYARIAATVCDVATNLRRGLTGIATKEMNVDQAFSPFEVACLNGRGKTARGPVTDPPSGRARGTVPYRAYLFYKRAGHLARTRTDSASPWTRGTR